jgi:hypothetical protein
MYACMRVGIHALVLSGVSVGDIITNDPRKREISAHAYIHMHMCKNAFFTHTYLYVYTHTYMG